VCRPILCYVNVFFIVMQNLISALITSVVMIKENQLCAAVNRFRFQNI